MNNDTIITQGIVADLHDHEDAMRQQEEHDRFMFPYQSTRHWEQSYLNDPQSTLNMRAFLLHHRDNGVDDRIALHYVVELTPLGLQDGSRFVMENVLSSYWDDAPLHYHFEDASEVEIFEPFTRWLSHHGCIVRWKADDVTITPPGHWVEFFRFHLGTREKVWDSGLAESYDEILVGAHCSHCGDDVMNYVAFKKRFRDEIDVRA
jgi:hypothetical protein